MKMNTTNLKNCMDNNYLNGKIIFGYYYKT